jgi:hypothetical protein
MGFNKSFSNVWVLVIHDEGQHVVSVVVYYVKLLVLLVNHLKFNRGVNFIVFLVCIFVGDWGRLGVTVYLRPTFLEFRRVFRPFVGLLDLAVDEAVPHDYRVNLLMHFFVLIEYLVHIVLIRLFNTQTTLYWVVVVYLTLKSLQLTSLMDGLWE